MTDETVKALEKVLGGHRLIKKLKSETLHQKTCGQMGVQGQPLCVQEAYREVVGKERRGKD